MFESVHLMRLFVFLILNKMGKRGCRAQTDSTSTEKEGNCLANNLKHGLVLAKLS